MKSCVQNRSKPEGSIARGYLAEECLSFCSLYLADYVESKFNQTARNEDIEIERSTESELDVFAVVGRPLGKGTPTNFDAETLKKAHQYVLFNCADLIPYIE